LKEFGFTERDPSVDGPPTNAIILAPDPGTQTPMRLAATLKQLQCTLMPADQLEQAMGPFAFLL
jgi:hypothetical protein